MNLLELYCHVDDFCNAFLPQWRKQLLSEGKKKRNRSSLLSTSEMMTILIHFHYSHYRDFKAYYLMHVAQHLRSEFPILLSYRRFVALIPHIFAPLWAYLQSQQTQSEGISFVDSTPIVVCHPKRIHSHKVFKELAALGRTTTGWFYGFKLHLICNHRGELIACRITPGNVDDRTPLPDMAMDVLGKLFEDKDYISQPLLKQENTLKNGITCKRKAAGWDHAYLLKVLWADQRFKEIK